LKTLFKTYLVQVFEEDKKDDEDFLGYCVLF